MIVSIVTELCKHYHNPTLEHFHHPKKKPVSFSHDSVFPHLALGNHQSTFCPYRFAFSWHFIEMEFVLCSTLCLASHLACFQRPFILWHALALNFNC